MNEKISNRNTNKNANLESHSKSKPQTKDKTKKADTQFSISVTHYRKRPADIDNLSIKAALDAIVSFGILPDDSPKYVKEIKHDQVKSEEEKTVFEIERSEE